MERARIHTYALNELDRLATANEHIAAQLPGMRIAADDPVLTKVLDDRVETGLVITKHLLLAGEALDHPPENRPDPLVIQFCRQAKDDGEVEEPDLRDLRLARTLLSMDQWMQSLADGLASMFRQLRQDEAAKQLRAAVTAIESSADRVAALRPSLTQLYEDDEAHGHHTRSPRERAPQNQLADLALSNR